jgi:phage terminase large subunit-like protein
MPSDKSIKDLGSVIEGIGSGAFSDELLEEEASRNFWGYKPWGFQEQFHKSEQKIRASFCANRCLPLNAPVLMANGSFKPLGKVKVGDKIMAFNMDTEEADITTVTATHRTGIQKVYKTTFKDGGSVISTMNHKFPSLIRSGRNRKYPIQKRQLSELTDVNMCSASKRKMLSPKKINTIPIKLPIHPYALGVILGDGSITQGGVSITSIDEGVIDKFNDHYEFGRKAKISYFVAQGAGHDKGKGYLNDKLKSLGLMGCNSGNKFIPEIYFTATDEDRMELLAGLVDTDGSFREYCSKSGKLAEDFCRLVRSLGGMAIKTECFKTCTNNGAVGIYSRVYWRLNRQLPLARKDKNSHGGKRAVEYHTRIIRKVEYEGIADCGDLTVEHDSHTYIAYDYVAVSNCGKTLSSILEVFICATGHIPESMKDWYPRKKIAPSNSVFFMATVTSDMHNEITHPLIRKFIPLKTFGIKWKQAKQCYECPNGIEIFLKSYDAGWDTFQGSGVWMVMLDEEPDDKKIYTECLTRILTTGGYLWFSMTPLKGYTFTYHDIYMASKKDLGIGVFSAKMYDCPYLDKAEIDKIVNKYPEHERKSRVNGEFCVAVESHVFDAVKLNHWLSFITPPVERYRIGLGGTMTNTITDLQLPIVIEEVDEFASYHVGQTNINAQAVWEIWREPEQGKGYVIGVDVASGQGEQLDHSIAHVKTVTKAGTIDHVATLRTDSIKPYDFGRVIVTGAMHYNNATVIVENEGYGDGTIDAMRWYPFHYKSSIYQPESKTVREKLGFLMKKNTRTTLFEMERDLISKQTYPIILDRETINEMMMFQICEDGRYDHPKGGRSDGIVASALADWVCMKFPNIVKDNAMSRRVHANEYTGGYRYKEDDPEWQKSNKMNNKYLGKNIKTHGKGGFKWT